MYTTSERGVPLTRLKSVGRVYGRPGSGLINASQGVIDLGCTTHIYHNI